MFSCVVMWRARCAARGLMRVRQTPPGSCTPYALAHCTRFETTTAADENDDRKTPIDKTSAQQTSEIKGEKDEAAHQAAREALIQAILSHDKEIFELKRLHELSMLRVEQHQRRILKDQEDRGMYYEQNCNVHTFDTISVGLYSQRSALYHLSRMERLRNVKLFLSVLLTIATFAYLYYRYMVNPDWAYVERPMKMLGSQVQALREMQEARQGRVAI